MRRNTIKEAENQNVKKVKLPFIRYCIVTTSVILSFSIIITFLLYRTDALINIDISTINNSAIQTSRTTVSTVIAQVEKEEATTPGVNTDPGVGTGTVGGGTIPGTTSPSAPINIPGLGDITDVMKLPPPGTIINARKLIDGSGYSGPRKENDSWTIENTYQFFKRKSPTKITPRIEALKSISTYHTADTPGELMYFDINGNRYYAAAIIEGFFEPCCAYEVLLSDGSKFNIVTVDCKAKEDPVGSGAKNQVNMTWGHGYYYEDGLQFSIVEFLAGGDDKLTIYSAADYPNPPVHRGLHVTEIRKRGKLVEM